MVKASKEDLFRAEVILREFRSEIQSPRIPMTSDYVFGKEIHNPVSGGKYTLDNWYLHFTACSSFYSDLSDIQLRLNHTLKNDINQVVERKIQDAKMIYPGEQLVMHQLCDWEWLIKEDGSILRPIVSMNGKSIIYEATLVKYAKILPEFKM